MHQLALGHQGLAPSDRAERPASPAFSGASSRLLQLDPELLQTMAAKVRKLKFCRALSQERRYRRDRSGRVNCIQLELSDTAALFRQEI